jgi:hypothetical protein
VIDERRRLSVTAGISLATHALAAGLLLLAPTASDQVATITQEVELIELTEPPPPPPQLVVADTPLPVPVAPARPARVDDPTTPPPETPIGAVAPSAPALAPTTPLTAMPAHPEEAPHTIHDVLQPEQSLHDQIDPSHVAAAIALQDDRGPTQEGPPATLNPEGPEHGPTAEEAVAQTEAYLGAQAAAKTYITHRTFHLTPHTDGTMHWQGTGFEAVIHPDGSVTFSDRPGVEYDWGTGQGSFDLTDMIMGSAGQDPHAAERAWFMEHAEDTIDQLEQQARARAAAHSVSSVRGRCRAIWQDATRTAADRRRAIFELWDEADETGDGRTARDQIIAFIRESIPDSSPDAYRFSEIARMNANRQSSERFEPYP